MVKTAEALEARQAYLVQSEPDGQWGLYALADGLLVEGSLFLSESAEACQAEAHRLCEQARAALPPEQARKLATSIITNERKPGEAGIGELVTVNGKPGIVETLSRYCQSKEVTGYCIRWLKSNGKPGKRFSWVDTCQIQRKEVMRVKVEMRWGHCWDAKEGYLKETKGQGLYVHVSEHYSNRNQGGYSFSGCPLGRGNSLNSALWDFVQRGRDEYQGKQPLSLSMLQIVETRDYRK